MEEDTLIKMLIEQRSSNNDPIRYANIVRASRSDGVLKLKELLPNVQKQLELLEQTEKTSSEFRKYVSGDGYARKKKRTKDVFSGAEQQKRDMDIPEVDVSVMVYEIYRTVTALYRTAYTGLESVSNVNMVSFGEGVAKINEEFSSVKDILGEDRVVSLSETFGKFSEDHLKNLALEQQMNQGSTSSFNNGIALLSEVPVLYVKMINSWGHMFEAYFEKLRFRHQSEGYKIFKTPSLTDAAILVWENIDRAGEIESGTSKDELSVYTTARAEALIVSLKDTELWKWVVAPESRILSWVNICFQLAKEIHNLVLDVKRQLNESTWKLAAVNLEASKKEVCDMIRDLELSQIVERTAEKSLSKTERFMMEHRNKSIASVADLLDVGADYEEIANEVLKLKAQEHKFFAEENSFYVCKVGNGNMFTGEAPGQLEVIPGEKPHVNLNHVWGGGFDEMREFISGYDDANKWQPLFLGTSPSGSTDKSNTLLVGPQGCGKTELMRAIASRDDSISIFALGSDFLTAWMGEAQKNPKRLFEQAMKLHKSTGRPVYILIDEIDMVLNDDRSVSRINLSLEFQNLMDGIVSYPGIHIWGATNHPERIPTPMLRRFAKVAVVGELSHDDRKCILKHYLERFLPCEDFSGHYDDWSERLNGATGDVVRKMVDGVWLEFMRDYIKLNKKQAEKVLAFITNKYGKKFELANFSDEDREKIKNMIKKNRAVTAELVSNQIDKGLDNFAVQQQISLAKETYSNAKKMLKAQKKQKSSFGF